MSTMLIQLIQKAVEAIQSNQFSLANTLLYQALEIEKNQPDALRFLGVVAAMEKRWDDALSFIDLAINSAPQHGIAYSNRGNILMELGRYEEALASYQKAIALQPNYAEAHSNMGNVLRALGRLEEALASYERAVLLDPNCVLGFYGAALIFLLRKKYEYALGCCNQALSVDPLHRNALTLKGNVYFQAKDYQSALAAYDVALSIYPQSSNYWRSKGEIFAEMKQFKEASIAYREALKIHPDNDFLLGNTIQNDLQMCKWDDRTNEINTLVTRTLEGQKASIPYNFISLLDDRKLIRRSIEIYANFVRDSIERVIQSPQPQNEKIRIGYFSADFHNHPTAHLIAELFECHDKSKFELIAFVYGKNTVDAMRRRLERSFDQFIDVDSLTDEEIAKLSRDLKIDIAVDLKGFTTDARPKIFMYGAAPIQISYLGFPGTMGLACFDYIIADSILIPDSSRDGFIEKVIYMPNSYQVNDRQRKISVKKPSRADLGLPDTGFIYCCFNNNYKITPSVLDGWIRILNAVEGSVLWLFADNPFAVESLKKEISARGLNPGRLIFADWLEPADHLERYQKADLFLDTSPCNAHTTASDALWAGLPLITLIGESFGARVAASLLSAVGLPNLITRTQKEYEELAIRLAQNPDELSEIKRQLLKNRYTHPLFDTALFTKHLENAYLQAYERHQMGLPPENILIS